MPSNKKKKLKKLFISPRPEDFVSNKIESGKCLLCDTWIGVNGVDHIHTHTIPPLPNAPSIDVRNEIVQTPCIIVSPELEEQDQEQEFTFPLPFESDKQENDNNENKIPNDIESPQTSSSAPCDSPDTVFSPSEPQSPSEERIILSEPHSTNLPLRNKRFNSISESSSSSEGSQIDIPPRGFFGSGSSPAINQYDNRRNNVPTKQDFNKLQGSRSLSASMASMASLEPYDGFSKRTRRNSMLGMRQSITGNSQIGQMGLCPGPMSPPGRSSSRSSLIQQPRIYWRNNMNESLILYVSALYAKLLVVMGMAFPMAETISSNVPLTFYHSFYLYLYFGSIFFLIYAYLFLLRAKSFTTESFKKRMHNLKNKLPRFDKSWRDLTISNSARNKTKESLAEREEHISVGASTYKQPKYTITESSNHGSMYLKMGAVIFGIGSMIYSGLEFGQYFELRSGPECANILMAISPVARMIFTFLQMYFIFLNSRVSINKHTIIARFGLMHMIGTNLCIWLNVLVMETKHEIAILNETYGKAIGEFTYNDHHDENSHIINHHEADDQIHDLLNSTPSSHNIIRRSASDDLYGCRRINLMGHVVSSASPFLFPCTIEYSLLCAGVLYVMWKNINVSRKNYRATTDGDSDISTYVARKVRHHYSVDCARASRGLFMGIFVLVLTIISLILFYVLISNIQFREFAILEANIIEVSIYSLSIVSVIVGMKQMRELEFMLEGDIELDNILLIIAQAGVYIYSSFTIIGGYFSLEENHTLPLLTAIMTLIQTTLQTLFILDGSRRCCYTADQLDRKPGREMVTFLLVCNLAMWAISTFETSRADVHPTQLHFYGIWAWTIISHVSMPLAIFYRFHVTVCLGEIWKRSYKLKHDLLGL